MSLFLVDLCVFLVVHQRLFLISAIFTREWTGQRLYSRCEHPPRGPPASQQRIAIPIALYARFCVSWSLQQMSKLQCACQGPQHIWDHLLSFELPRCSACTCMKEAVCLRWAVDELCLAGEQIQKRLSIVEVQCLLSMSTPHQYSVSTLSRQQDSPKGRDCLVASSTTCLRMA
jgi:hypothetical protein